MENQNNFKKTVGAFIIGTVIGGILGTLLAKDKGRETMEKLQDKYEGFTESLKCKFQRLIDGIKSNITEQKKQGNDHQENKTIH